ncbi:MAG: patatin-like phospholipase family protein [Gammaproteobacteria bacterium]
MKRKLTALALQGGGALGAYEYGVLKAFYEQGNFQPDVVTGVSIGAFAAAVLVGAKDDPMSALGQMWERLTLPVTPFLPAAVQANLAVFGNDAMYRIKPDYLAAPWLASSVYDTGPLRESLLQWVDFDRLNNSSTFVAVTAVNVETGELMEFNNRQGLSVEHIIASGSLPPAFPPTTIDGQVYWDGGLVSNTPLRAAINALEQLAPGAADVSRELIVIDAFRQTAPVPEQFMDVLERTFEIIFASKLKLDLKLFHAVNGMIELMGEIDQALPADSPVRQLPAYRKLLNYRHIDRLLVVSNTHNVDIGGPADFSRAAIQQRIELGYHDGRDALAAAHTGKHRQNTQ